MSRIRWPYVGAGAMILVGCAVALLSLPGLGGPAAVPATPTLRPTTTLPPVLAVPVTPTAAQPPTPAPTPTTAPTPTPRPTPQASHVVQPGDTLLGIALRYDVSMARIQIENDLGESLTVRGGQTLAIPARAFPDEQPFWRARVVKAGDTLSSIATEAGVSVADLDRVNGLGGSTVIRPGATLILPTSGPAAFPPPAPATAVVSKPTVAPSRIPTREPAPTATPARAAAVAAPAIAPVSGDAEQQLLAYYNGARAAAGVAPLRLNAALSAAARAHAQDCATRGYGSHVGSDGADTKTRVTRAGYASPFAWGENWAWARSAAQAWDMWFTQEYPSGPHRNNILSARYTEVGFGIIAAQGGFYYIADFGAR